MRPDRDCTCDRCEVLNIFADIRTAIKARDRKRLTIQDVLNAERLLELGSLDEDSVTDAGEELSVLDILETEDERPEAELVRQQFWDEACQHLSKREQMILRMKYFGDLNYREIAELIGGGKRGVGLARRQACLRLAGHINPERYQAILG